MLDGSGVIDKGRTLWSLTAMDPSYYQVRALVPPFVRKAAAGGPGTHSVAREKKEYLSCERATGGFQSAGSPFKGQNTRPRQAWTTRRKQKCWEHSPNRALQSPWWRPGRSLRQRVMRPNASNREMDDADGGRSFSKRHRRCRIHQRR